MPKVSDTYLEARRQQVLDAAYTCFARNGFHATTMQDIAREAGVSYGVVYHYFSSKEDVIAATWEASREARKVRFQKALERPTTQDAVAEFLNLSVGRLEQPAQVPEMRMRVQLFGEALLNPRVAETLRSIWNDVLETFEDVIRQGQQRGEIGADVDARALGRAYLAVHDGLVVQKAIDPTVDLGKVIEVFWALHQGALWGPRAGDGSHENVN